MGGQTSELVLEAGALDRHYWKNLWDYRELFFFLAWRDIIVRYKQTVVGMLWALGRPILVLGVFTLVFHHIANLSSPGIPYPLLVFAGLWPWQLFSSALSGAGDSLVSNAGMISKIYFPRLIIPASAILVSAVDFLLSGVILIALMIGFQVTPSWHLMTLPLFLLVTLAAAWGGGVWISALNVRYRDFRILVPFVVQMGLYLSPIGFSSQLIPERWKLLYSMNPMVGVIEGFRWAILGTAEPFYWPGFLLSLVLIAGILYTGICYFRRVEKTFADMI